MLFHAKHDETSGQLDSIRKTYIEREKPSDAHYHKFGNITNSVGLIAGVLFFLFARMIAPGSPFDALGFYSLIVALIVDRVAAGFQRSSDLAQLETSYKRILGGFTQLKTDIAHSFSVQYAGTADTAAPVVVSKILQASHVKNTFVNIGGSEYSSSVQNRLIASTYKDFLFGHDQNVWQDIVSVNELFDGRFTSIKKTDGPYGHHTVGVLRHNMPLINFTLLAKPGQDFSELYFGWLHDTANRSSDIYYSEDRKLIETFEDYFDLLWRDKTHEQIKIHYEDEPNVRLNKSETVNKKGHWCTFAFKNGKLDEVESFGVFEIDFRDTRPVVSGFVFNVDLSRKSEINHTSIVHTGNKLYFEFQGERLRNRREGFCVYEFSKCLGREVILGYFVDNRERERRDLIGIKIEEEKSINELSRDTEAVAKIREREKGFAAEIGRMRGYAEEEGNGTTSNAAAFTSTVHPLQPATRSRTGENSSGASS
jgi:hypothetical protein